MKPLLLLAALAIIAPAAGAAGAGADQDRQTDSWTVARAPEEDGGFIVRMAHIAGALSIEVRAVFWRGNYGIYMDSSAAGEAGPCGASTWRHSWGDPILAPEVRGRLVADLAACGLGDGDQAALLRGFEPAFARFKTAFVEAERLIDEENEAIMRHGSVD